MIPYVAFITELFVNIHSYIHIKKKWAILKIAISMVRHSLHIIIVSVRNKLWSQVETTKQYNWHFYEILNSFLMTLSMMIWILDRKSHLVPAKNFYKVRIVVCLHDFFRFSITRGFIVTVALMCLAYFQVVSNGNSTFI